MEFTVQTIIPVKRKKVYNAWLSSKKHSKMTGAEAQVSDEVGGTFLAWDGYISGTNIILKYKKRIVQFWRTTEFADDVKNSQIEILFKKVKEGTEITLNHTNLPEHGMQYKQGWEDHYFTPMKEYFGEK
jgi:activator of HSP90 ATPase